ncbi:PKD-like family lipoprotein [Carboxylicivirga marina]|uniref:PKD-like family protein n=1 Tax=Carboxylicivirga marina TaxID=2800988 RepID=A0ABS1HHC6_9BACT|nr:PKD-like family lipoprotein [Carboxylicivirga marina]MBK3516991.1 hypothetical protein [Carboxylicivirga marina]
MRRSNYFALWIISLTIILHSCYDDLGNYDYMELNDISLSGIDSLYVVKQFDTLSITPFISQKIEADESKLEYFWHMYPENRINYSDTLSFDRDMEKIIGSPPGLYMAAFEVTDSETGVFYKHEFFIKVISNYSDGLMILSNIDELANVTFINTAGDLFHDLYFKVNGSYAGRNPTALGHGHFHDRSDNGVIMILCNDEVGGVVTEPIGFMHIGEYSDLFWIPPSESKPMAYYSFGSFYDDAVIDNGQLYFRTWFSMPPVRYQAPQTQETKLYPAIFKGGWSGLVVYDNANERFMAKGMNYANVVPEKTGAFNPADVGMQMIYGGKGYKGLGYGVFYDDNLSEYYILSYTLSTSSVTPGQKTLLSKGSGIDQATAFAVYTQSPLLYFAVDNILYYWDQSKREIIAGYTFDESLSIDYLEFDVYNSNLLYVGTSDSNSVSKKQGNLHYLSVSFDGATILTKTYPNVGGKIVDVMDKRPL